MPGRVKQNRPCHGQPEGSCNGAMNPGSSSMTLDRLNGSRKNEKNRPNPICRSRPSTAEIT
jgi:hypothetical protein